MEPYTEHTRRILDNAAIIAREMGHPCIGSEHILLAMTKDQGSIGGTALNRMRITPYVMEKTVRDILNEKQLTPTPIMQLLSWSPHWAGNLKAHAKINDPELQGYATEDEDAPFFSEACLYNLLGKEDARTVLALLRKAFESVGVNLRD